MLRHGVFASFVFVLCFTFVAAEEIKGRISKIDDKGVTVLLNKDDKDGKTYSFAKDCKFSKMVKKAKEEIKDGVKSEAFQNLPKKGLNATIITNDDGRVTEVIVTGKKKAAN